MPVFFINEKGSSTKPKPKILSYLNKNKAYRTESTTSCEKSWILDEMDCSVSTKESKEHNLQISLRPHERDSAVI